MAIADLLSRWEARAEDLAPYAAPAAEAFRRAARELEAELRAAGDEPLSLEQAAQESGYSSESLRHMVRDGTIPNAGRRGAPRIRRADLPRRPARTASAYDAGEDALSIVRRAGSGGRRPG
jgi:hypothetical protein